MNLLKGVKRLAEILLFLSFISFTASPITNLIGIHPPQQFNNVMGMLRFTVLSGFVILAVTLMILVGVGYLIFTGWRDYKMVPKPLRICFAFVLGAVALSLSGPLSLLVPIPLLPTVIAAISLWGLLRAVSNLTPSAQSHDKQIVKINEAITSAVSSLKDIEPDAQDIDILESKIDGKNWKVSLLSRVSTKKYEIDIDGGSGGVIKWKRV